MAGTAKKSDPKLWDKVKRQITRGTKGGEAGEWSARKAQLATQEYKKQGGGYEGKKSPDNHLSEWQHEEWGTKSGKRSKDTGERYLPKKSRETLSDAEYKKTSDKKRADTKSGKQFSKQPRDIAKKAANARKATQSANGSEHTKEQLMAKARKQNLPGRSKMTKAQLERALA